MSGLRVKHKFEEIDDGVELVLEDVSVLDTSESGLVNPLLRENSKAKANQDLKKLVFFT